MDKAGLPPKFTNAVLKQINEAIKAAFDLGLHIGRCEREEKAGIPPRVNYRLRRKVGGNYQVVKRTKKKDKLWIKVFESKTQEAALDYLAEKLGHPKENSRR